MKASETWGFTPELRLHCREYNEDKMIYDLYGIMQLQF